MFTISNYIYTGNRRRAVASLWKRALGKQYEELPREADRSCIPKVACAYTRTAAYAYITSAPVLPPRRRTYVFLASLLFDFGFRLFSLFNINLFFILFYLLFLSTVRTFQLSHNFPSRLSVC